MASKRTGKKPKLGSGKRFAALKSQLASKSGKTKSGKSRKVSNPGALAAWIGRKKYGAKKFAKLSAGGRKRGK